MVPVPVTVRLVEVDADHGVPDPCIVQVPDPMAIVLTFELAALILFADVTLYETASSVPEVRVNAVQDIASLRANDPDGELMVKVCPKVFPALVMV